jgi:hypothetical protein
MAIWRGEKFLILEEERTFSSLQIVQTGGLFPGVTRPEREFDRSPPSTVEV